MSAQKASQILKLNWFIDEIMRLKRNSFAELLLNFHFSLHLEKSHRDLKITFTLSRRDFQNIEQNNIPFRNFGKKRKRFSIANKKILQRFIEDQNDLNLKKESP